MDDFRKAVEKIMEKKKVKVKEPAHLDVLYR